MLESLYISKSKIRQDLLALFFTNPKARYYLRELQRILGYSAGSIRRELMRFKNDGLLFNEKIGNLLYYKINSEHPLFNELKAIVSKTVGIEGSIKKEISSIKSINYAFIYGSFAADREKATSDIDLMIIGDPDVIKLSDVINKLETKLQRTINPTVYSLLEYRERKEAKQGFINNLLNNPKIMLIGEEDDL